MRTLMLGAVAAALVISSGCMLNFNSIPGSGISATENRTVGDFHAISVSGTADAVVTVGGEKSVTVTFDDNLLEIVRTEVSGGELRIWTEGNYNSKVGLDIQVTVPSLDKATVSGVGDLVVTGVSGPSLKVDVSGVGEAKISGEVDSLDVSVSGTGDAKLKDLVAKSVTVDASGVGGAEVYASESVDADASGTSDIKIYGNPENVKKDASGIGDVELVK
jgi:hypothetical protein